MIARDQSRINLSRIALKYWVVNVPSRVKRKVLRIGYLITSILPRFPTLPVSSRWLRVIFSFQVLLQLGFRLPNENSNVGNELNSTTKSGSSILHVTSATLVLRFNLLGKITRMLIVRVYHRTAIIVFERF